MSRDSRRDVRAPRLVRAGRVRRAGLRPRVCPRRRLRPGDWPRPWRIGRRARAMRGAPRPPAGLRPRRSLPPRLALRRSPVEALRRVRRLMPLVAPRELLRLWLLGRCERVRAAVADRLGRPLAARAGRSPVRRPARRVRVAWRAVALRFWVVEADLEPRWSVMASRLERMAKDDALAGKRGA